jgi:hypothetical protein
MTFPFGQLDELDRSTNELDDRLVATDEAGERTGSDGVGHCPGWQR